MKSLMQDEEMRIAPDAKMSGQAASTGISWERSAAARRARAPTHRRRHPEDGQGEQSTSTLMSVALLRCDDPAVPVLLTVRVPLNLKFQSGGKVMDSPCLFHAHQLMSYSPYNSPSHMVGNISNLNDSLPVLVLLSNHPSSSHLLEQLRTRLPGLFEPLLYDSAVDGVDFGNEQGRIIRGIRNDIH